MRIHIETIPAQAMRNQQAGDWQFRNGDLYIQVAQLGDWRMEACIGFHEQFEALACLAAGIEEKSVDEFDANWQEHDGIAECGDDPKAPYHEQHVMAGIPERLLAISLGLEWDDYSKAVDAL